MNKAEILNKLNEYNFDTNEYIVISSAALVIQGVKEETKDIDISVTPKYYKYLEENYNCELERYDEKNNINIYYIDDVINFSTNYYSEDKDDFILLDGIKIQSISSVTRLKNMLNRPKDIKDIELINKFLGKSK